MDNFAWLNYYENGYNFDNGKTPYRRRRSYANPHYYGEWEQTGPTTGSGPAGSPPASGGGQYSAGGGTYNPDNYKDKAFIPPEKRQATADYLAYVKWKRQELGNLMKTYRTEFPKQIEAFQVAARGDLERKAPEMWGQRHVNLQQRGLEDSPNFLAGAKQEQENWYTGEQQGIKDTAFDMKRKGQDAMLAAVGKPDYAANYANWSKYGQQMNEFMDYLRKKAGP